jgi:hypothetical protein
MKNKIEKVLLRKFAIPIIIVFIDIIQGNVNFRELILLFSFVFFLNWIFDVTVVEWSIKKGKEKGNKKNNNT